MKIYVASSWRTPSHPDVVTALRAAGHEVYDYRASSQWVGDNTVMSYAQMISVTKDDKCLTEFNRDDAALEWAETLVLVLPAGRSAHTEFGYMCGQDKLTVVIWFPSEPELLHMLADRIVENVEAAVKYLEAFVLTPTSQIVGQNAILSTPSTRRRTEHMPHNPPQTAALEHWQSDDKQWWHRRDGQMPDYLCTCGNPELTFGNEGV